MSQCMTKLTKWQNEPNDVYDQRRQISLGIRHVRSDSLLSAWSKQRMRLGGVFGGRTGHFVGLVIWRLKWICRFCLFICEIVTNGSARLSRSRHQLSWRHNWLHVDLNIPVCQYSEPETNLRHTVRYPSKRRLQAWFLTGIEWAEWRDKLSWAALWQNQQNGMCAQRRLRSDWASTQSDQRLRCPHEESLCP